MGNLLTSHSSQSSLHPGLQTTESRAYNSKVQCYCKDVTKINAY